MSGIKTYTSKDICGALGGISRSRLHKWSQLPPFVTRPTRERSARRFNKSDILTMAVIKFMEDNLGVERKFLPNVSKSIHDLLCKPNSSQYQEWLFVPLAGKSSLVNDGNFKPTAGWVIDLTSIRLGIDTYFGISQPQQELALITSMGGV